jgi:hypothetical protein
MEQDRWSQFSPGELEIMWMALDNLDGKHGPFPVPNAIAEKLVEEILNSPPAARIG